eukprot:4001496-Pleurochrysis_carterae.AAC.1
MQNAACKAYLMRTPKFDRRTGTLADGTHALAAGGTHTLVCPCAAACACDALMRTCALQTENFHIAPAVGN